MVRLLLLFLLPSLSLAEDWPCWRGPRGDGTWLAPKLPEKWPAEGPRILWRTPIGPGYCGVSVAEGRVFTMDLQKKESTTEERIVCLSAKEGKLLWSHSWPVKYGSLGGYPNGPRSVPTIDRGRVYALGAVGNLWCLEAESGKVLWSRDLVREEKARVPDWGYAASPVVDGDRLIVHVGAQPNGCILALDRHSGKELWRSLPDPAGYATPIFADTRAGRQLIVWTPEHLHGLQASDGKPLWKLAYPITYGVSIATPIFRDDIAFVSGYWDGSRTMKIDEKKAEPAWEDRKNIRGLMAAPLYREGIVYSLDRDHGIQALELKTGRILWNDDNKLTPKGRNPHACFVWINDKDRILAVNSEGELILGRMNPKGYEEQSRAKVTKQRVWSHPAFAGKCVFLREDGGEGWQATKSLELICVEVGE